MRIATVSSAAIALSMLAAPAANATVIYAGLGNSGTPFVTIDSLGTRVGGTIYTADQPFADIPAGSIYNNQFLASGPSSTNPSTITFSSPTLSYLSFLWGSPDLYNKLTLTTNLGTYNYDVTGLGFATTNGDQTKSQYVQFQFGNGEFLKSATFDVTSPTDAFEVANFRTAVPEPATWALMIMGIGFAGAAMRRRQTVSLKYA